MFNSQNKKKSIRNARWSIRKKKLFFCKAQKLILVIFLDLHLFSAGTYFNSMTACLYGMLHRDTRFKIMCNTQTNSKILKGKSTVKLSFYVRSTLRRITFKIDTEYSCFVILSSLFVSYQRLM